MDNLAVALDNQLSINTMLSICTKKNNKFPNLLMSMFSKKIRLNFKLCQFSSKNSLFESNALYFSSLVFNIY